MHILYSGIAVLVLGAMGYLGGSVPGLRVIFGAFIPYSAFLIFLCGVTYRVVRWARSPVPFRIPTTCGQQKSLPWIRSGWLESPSGISGTLGRMGLEVLLFRSLFRNNRMELHPDRKLSYAGELLLGVASLAFHWSLLIIVLRHLRFYFEPVPGFVTLIETLDGWFQVSLPPIYLTDAVLLTALSYLLVRRLKDAPLRYISLFTDYFALFLLLGLSLSGVYLRYFDRLDLLEVKQLALGLVHFTPDLSPGLRPSFFVHLFLICVLVGYFPFSKLIHMGGVFLSPTRNLPNNSRMKRHVNPWHRPAKVHTYEEWETEFRDKILACGMPLDRE